MAFVEYIRRHASSEGGQSLLSLVKRSISEVDDDENAPVEIRGSTGTPYTVTRHATDVHRYDLRGANNLLAGFALVEIIDGELVLGRIMLMRRNERLCTSFLTAVLTAVIAHDTADGTPPQFGNVKIESAQARNAFSCYVKAYGNVGYVLIEGTPPPFEVAPAGEIWEQQLRFEYKH